MIELKMGVGAGRHAHSIVVEVIPTAGAVGDKGVAGEAGIVTELSHSADVGIASRSVVEALGFEQHVPGITN